MAANASVRPNGRKNKKLSPKEFYTDDCVVCSLHNHAPQELYTSLLDMSSVESWWPDWVNFSVTRVTEEGIGSELSIETQLGSVDLEITEAEEPKEITFAYKGAMKGEVTWTLEKESEEKHTTKVCYWMDLYPGSFALRPMLPLFGIPYIKSCLSDIAVHLDKHLESSTPTTPVVDVIEDITVDAILENNSDDLSIGVDEQLTKVVENDVTFEEVEIQVQTYETTLPQTTEELSENDIFDDSDNLPLTNTDIEQDELVHEQKTPVDPFGGVRHSLEPSSFIIRPYMASFVGTFFPLMHRASFRSMMRSFTRFTRNRLESYRKNRRL